MQYKVSAAQMIKLADALMDAQSLLMATNAKDIMEADAKLRASILEATATLKDISNASSN